VSGFVLPPAPADWLEQEKVQEGWLDGYLDHFSASGLRLLRVCPRAWQQRYLKGRKERPGEALTLGKAVHNAVGFSHQQKIKSHVDLPVSEVVEYFHDKAWNEAVAKDGGVDEIRWDKKPEEVRRDGERVTSAYHRSVSPRIQPLAVEREIRFVVPGVPVYFLGYIDVEEETNNIDLKTGKQVQKKPDANWRMQGVLYTAYTGKPTHFHSVSRAQTPSIATPLQSEQMVVSLAEAQREHVERTLRDYALQVEWYFKTYGPDDDWPTNGVFSDYKGGPACNYCGFRNDCPAWAHERVVTDMINLDGTPITL
jgi:CRISPR/Cas system-associated exonuclease Cas4 (RecB family)